MVAAINSGSDGLLGSSFCAVMSLVTMSNRLCLASNVNHLLCGLFELNFQIEVICAYFIVHGSLTELHYHGQQIDLY